MVSLPAPSSSTVASKRKLERMGMVVLRSTTDWAAVSSRRSSARETVISRLPVGTTSGVMAAVDKMEALPWSGSSANCSDGDVKVVVDMGGRPSGSAWSDTLILGVARGFVRVTGAVNFRGHLVRCCAHGGRLRVAVAGAVGDTRLRRVKEELGESENCLGVRLLLINRVKV